MPTPVNCTIKNKTDLTCSCSDPKECTLDNATETGSTKSIDFSKYTNICMEDCKLKKIDTLSQCKVVQKLILNNNDITNISPLSSLTNLTDFELSNNQITDISPLSGLTSLTELDLRWNQIKDITKLSGLIPLQTLLLYSNQIEDISPLANLVKLDTLDLICNKITNSIKNCTAYKAIQINMKNLSPHGQLTIEHNPCTTTPVTCTINKTDLNCSCNDPKECTLLGATETGSTKSIDYYKYTNISMENCKLKKIDTLLSLKWTKPLNLINLNLSNNQIIDISNISRLDYLQTLNLANNQIQNTSPLSGFEFISLLNLNLSNNKISNVSPFSIIGALRTLNLSNNKISNVSPFSIIGALRTLNLSSNQITSIDPLAHYYGVNLNDLNLCSNEIQNNKANCDSYNHLKSSNVNVRIDTSPCTEILDIE